MSVDILKNSLHLDTSDNQDEELVDDCGLDVRCCLKYLARCTCIKVTTSMQRGAQKGKWEVLFGTLRHQEQETGFG